MHFYENYDNKGDLTNFNRISSVHAIIKKL